MKLFYIYLILLTNYYSYSQGIKHKSNDFKFEDKYVEIDEKYPEFRYNDKKITKLNDSLLSYVKNAKDEIISQAEEVKELIDSGFTSGKYSLKVSYEFSVINNQYISVLYKLYYYTLGAHGNISYHSYLFDVKQNKFIEFYKTAGIYGQDYLDSFNDLLKKYFVNTDSCFSTYPKIETENYDMYFVDNDFLYIYFLPYELGPYSCGSAIVKIPFYELKKSLFFKNQKKQVN